ncbi:hypothetical protein KZ483_01705 [Paenibacillus sp. sptzw28]|uniref:hypothetical protein n=1 Tax=Paenibacillus sp. sptzw28 TaxID=715179 RepID=UPI001C6F580D|nr:hypothetical protein [Paenibacillus sp. sptzw28]QYR21784.1 hypothetical protein KZ483_01705 [Paenibacillus sp. sptzw28]
MADAQVNESARNFMLSNEIFQQPGVDIYAQMTYIVLKCYSSESYLPDLRVIAKHGRMNLKQVTKALQSLVELKILPHKIYRQMVGDFQDDRLSWAAKGLLTFCKEHPHVNLNDLLELSCESGEDEQSIRRALKELSQFGYLEEYPEWNKIAN